MSKVNELKKIYSNIHASTFEKFSVADSTPTKKYLPYFLKMWVDKKNTNTPNQVHKLIVTVSSFDELVPYIENKDIFSKEYCDFKRLEKVVLEAEAIREEKTFVRDEHCITLNETEEYLLISPKTYRGSIRYGANTKWCTASKHDQSTFHSYIKSGYLVYLLDKTNKVNENYRKVAFYINNSYSPFQCYVNYFNALDKESDDADLIKNGWSEELLFEIITRTRLYFYNASKVRRAKKAITSVTTFLNNLDYDELQKSLNLIDKFKEFDYIIKMREETNKFLENLKLYENAD
jgi:hypothetical protein